MLRPPSRRFSLPSRRLSPPAAFAAVTGMLMLAIGASALPSPLYAIYQAQWGFSTFTLTVVFAVYAAGVLAALLLTGRLSDEIGRRPVLIASLLGLLLSTAIFLAARSVPWLVAARAVQGVATGGVMSAGGAAMLDFYSGEDGAEVGLVTGVFSGLGMAAGALGASVLAQDVSAPLITPFIVLAVLLVVALTVALLLPEPVVRAARPALRPQPPHVPRAIRGHFVLAALGVMASWSVMGLYLALGPKLADQLIGTTNLVAGGVALATLVGSGIVAQVAVRTMDPRHSTTRGAAVLAAGLALNAASLSTGSPAFFLLTVALTGVGFGMAFVGALRSLTEVVPPAHRAEVMSAFYLVAYTSMSVPALAAGLASSHVGLFGTFRIFAGAVAVVSLAVVVAAGRTRPEADPVDATTYGPAAATAGEQG